MMEATADTKVDREATEAATAVMMEATADTKVDREATEAAKVVISEAVTACHSGYDSGASCLLQRVY
ncbi:hypothetical protein ACMYSQ_012631 [Aspergillus niger]